ncbi:MAG: hypothetical protein KBC98_01270 [Candidatus Pacebacteria bacterium]|jgi:hypothetical protein|nr:hypothetical protein [Candidatus Paceibacterota bacterium]
MKNYLLIIACALIGILSSCNSNEEQPASVPVENEVIYFNKAWKQLLEKENTTSEFMLIKVTGTESEFSIPAVKKENLLIGILRGGQFILKDTTLKIGYNSIVVDLNDGARYFISCEGYLVGGKRVKVDNNLVKKEDLSTSEIIDILKKII